MHETILWSQRTGNRFTKSLEPAMDSDSGYAKTTKVRRIGDPVAKTFDVIYNRSYLLEFIGYILCRPLQIFGKEKVLNLVDEAWENYYNSDKSFHARMRSN